MPGAIMCGVFAILGTENISDALHHGLIQLQHRGQDAAGVFTYQPPTGEYYLHRDLGLVTEIFSKRSLPKGQWGIGHVRYPTTGSHRLSDAHPHVLCWGKYQIALAYNGNLTNYSELKLEIDGDLSNENSSDVELILKYFCLHLPKENLCKEDLAQAAQKLSQKLQGAYSIVGLVTDLGIFAIRDALGIKPLLWAKQKATKTYAIASESQSLTFMDSDTISNVKPGSFLWIDKEAKHYTYQFEKKAHAHCSFEWAYFAQANSILDEQETYISRSRLGELLAAKIKELKLELNVVVAVPDSARPAAISAARALGLPYEEGFVRRNYIGRTFIMPSQNAREKAISRKLSTVESVFKNKNVLLIDDSIVRGTVSKKVVRLAREAGAQKVYFASTFPPIRHPCYYGLDFPERTQLLGYQRNNQEIADAIRADGVVYTDTNDLITAIGLNDLCTACVTGKYPI